MTTQTTAYLAPSIRTDATTRPTTASIGLARPSHSTDEGDPAALPCLTSDDPDLWFAERTTEVELAKSMCGPCPLREACLAGAVERGEPWGVWGGEVFVDGVVVAVKRGRGRPRKNAAA
ncbi:WhiB family transcriptional regulator [Georgenia sp. Z1344]|uniref:WhiB family transcriptional regulator n=1 Tax=Georgenia sp. Z1344 TaxID=3416706 RepID=UPI003CF49DF1